MSDATPIAWLCKHCGERVDPTMDLCWNCGHDREGVAHPSIFVEPVFVDLTRCGRCEYPLKGNPDATHCPECGEPVPWMDCPDCGVRASRLEMAEGCPACKAAKTGQLFIPEVGKKQVLNCPECQYDLTGRPDCAACPECGAPIDRGRYETIFTDESESTRLSTRKSLGVWVVLLIMWFPIGILLFYVLMILGDQGWEELAVIVGVFWFVFLIICAMQVFQHPYRQRTSHNNPDRRKQM